MKKLVPSSHALLASAALLASLSGGLDARPQETGAASAEAPAPAPAVDRSFEDEGWMPVDEVELIVNGDIVTHQELSRRMERERGSNPLSTERQVQEMQMRILVSEADWILGNQAGKNLGIDPRLVNQLVEKKLEQIIENEGVLQFSEYIKSRDWNSQKLRERFAADIYRNHWERLVVGKEPGMDGRFTKDRFVRPGYLQFNYELIRRDDRFIELIGGIPEQLTMQQIVIGVEESGGIEPARQLAAGVRLRALGGEVFGKLVAEVSLSPENEGFSEPVSMLELGNASEELRRFLAGARPGDISIPLEITRDGEVAAWRLVRLHERKPPVVPSFDDAEVQRRIETLIRRNKDERRIFEALNELYEGAYIWPTMTDQRRPPVPIGGMAPPTR